MSGGPLFSVLVPVYNTAAWLRDCVDSVLAQGCGDFELLLVDDGSRDESGAICDAYAAADARVRVYHKENGGAFQSRVFAVSEAKGGYVLFLDSDDRLAPHALETLAAAIRDTDADCLIFGLRWDKPGGAEELVCPAAFCGRVITDRRAVLNLVLNDDSYNSLCRKCARRSCFDGRDFTPYYSVSSGEDRLQSTQLLENASRFLFLPDVLYFYRFNDSSVTHSIRWDARPADFAVARFLHDWLTRLGVFEPEDFDRLRNHLLDELALDLRRLCRFCSKREHALRGMAALREQPFFCGWLSAGYRPAAPVAGLRRPSALRRLRARLILGLFRRRRFSLIYFLERRA